MDRSAGIFAEYVFDAVFWRVSAVVPGSGICGHRGWAGRASAIFVFAGAFPWNRTGGLPDEDDTVFPFGDAV